MAGASAAAWWLRLASAVLVVAPAAVAQQSGASAPDVGIVNFQPIFGYPLGGGRSISLGNSAIIYDTERSRWTSLLASVSYGQVVTFWGNTWRPNFEVGYDVKDDVGNPKWVIRAGIALLLPK